MTKLEYLKLDKNQLVVLPSHIDNLTSLINWFVVYQLTVLSPEIGNLANLHWLALFRNQLTVLPPEVGNLANLKFLYLDNNKLWALTREINNLKPNMQFDTEAGHQLSGTKKPIPN